MKGRRLTEGLSAATLAAVLFAAPLHAFNFHLDGSGGSDAASGRTPEEACKTFGALAKANLKAGDTLRLKAGTVFQGPLELAASGTEAARLVVTSYGEGPKPAIEFPNQGSKPAVNIHGSWVTFEKIAVRKVFLTGVSVTLASHHIVLQDLEVTDCGLGVVLDGTDNVVARGDFHDLHIVVNTPGGNDDYGAVGVVIANSRNTVRDSRFIRCIGPSQDYGFDGGGVEVWAGDRDVKEIQLLRNYAWRTCGFFEIGGKGFTVENVRVAYNVLSDCFGLSYTFINNSGDYKISLKNYRFENNTLAVHACPKEKIWTCIAFDTPSEAGVFTMRNNLFFVPHADRILWNATSPVVANNLIWHPGTEFFQPNYALAPTDIQGKDPLFKDPGTCEADGNYELQAGSPARDAGMALLGDTDNKGRKVPTGPFPDIGAMEYDPAAAAIRGQDRGRYRPVTGLRSGMAGARLVAADGRLRSSPAPTPAFGR